MGPFVASDFRTRPAIAQIETDLRKWLRGCPPSERVVFLRELWPVNPHFALVLAGACQLPAKEAEALLAEWLLGESRNARAILRTFVPLLGAGHFWCVVAETETTEAMAHMLEYHRNEV